MKLHIAVIAGLVGVGSACGGSGRDRRSPGTAPLSPPPSPGGSGNATAGPGAALGAPSSKVLNKSGKVSLALKFTPSPAGGSALTDTLTTTGGGVKMSVLSGNPACAVAVDAISVSGATITLAGCSGDGPFKVHVNAGTLKDADGAPSSPADSDVITVDNTPPELVSLTPASAAVNPAPTAVMAAFSEPVEPLTAANLAIGGTCGTLPSVGGVTMDASGRVATATLNGAVCTDGQSVTVTVDPGKVADAAGNHGTGAATTSTYTVSTAGPTSALGVPSATLLNAAGSSSLSLVFTPSSAGGTALAGSLTPAGGGVTVTTLTGNPSCTVAVSDISAGGAELTLSGCTGDGTLTMAAAAGLVTDQLQHPSTGSSPSPVITVDNTAPASGAAITFTGTTTTGTTVNWGAATDGVTPAPYLSYKLVTATSAAALATVALADAITNPTEGLVMPWTETVTSFPLSSLVQGQTSYFAVLVTDQAGNEALYAPAAVTPTPIPLFVYMETPPAQANLGGRAGADAICKASANAAGGCQNWHAVAAFSSTDAVANLAATFAIPPTGVPQTVAGTTLAPSWAQLLAGGPAAAVTSGYPYFFSFTNADGTFNSTYNCASGTVNDASYAAAGGAGGASTTWLYEATPTCSDTSSQLLCICW